MKVILIKDTKDGKANTIVEVSPGYATNFLFKNNLAEPFNSRTERLLNQRKQKIAEEYKNKKDQEIQLKNEIENIVLWFKLKGTNNFAHGAISAKKIKKELENKGIFVDKQTIQTSGIQTFGTSFINIKLSSNIVAKLKINVIKDE
ncbi:50S ribosomal protein L9 [Mesomycoplasma flocculare]|uniref:50S ribosomal protein L9 n=1 Tax=Mesomycoplasma flocculare TaxID=2128 RepID=UPI00136CA995|nr:50S ribosomal protein L9 [Mesomycoplasma flocculare]MXR06077.1 50S ribosomal protein L9 [Mesomycoplasma flocculare]MXR12223.1 50S ribosomal protein L9 [Mesomycoplasma flocculare]MXR39650.1 50S ribosomal protein L9 [Mycoplasma sp. MF12]